MTDVNAAFDASKLDQIQAEQDKAAAVARRVADGELRDNGNGTFTVLTGWDKGEVIRLSVRDGSAEILAEHGLDALPNGNVALYSRQREWFGLGTIVPDGLTDIAQVIDLIGGPMEYSKQPAFYRDLMTGELREIPGAYAAVWMDQDGKNAAMGTVGAVYKHAQDGAAAEFLLDLIGQEVVWESVGRMQNNAKFFAGLRLTEDMVIDPQGIADGIAQYLYLLNSHDGSGKLTCVVTPWRIRCRNTERFAVRDARTSWGVRHTTNWSSSERKAQARQSLGLTTAYYASWKAEAEELLAWTPSGLEIDKFWALVEDLDSQGAWKRPEKEGRSANSYHKRMADLEARWVASRDELGRNGYALERAVTGYLDHGVNRRPGKFDTADEAARGVALLGGDDDKKAALHTGLLELARA